MGYPTRLLSPDEVIGLDLRPHWKALVVPVLIFLVTAGAAGFLAAVVPELGGAELYLRIAIGVLALLVVLRWTCWPWLKWVTTNYTITNRRLITRVGVITREGRDMPLARVNDVSFSHDSLLERILGCGTLVVESAGERGQLVLESVPRVEEVQRELYRLVEEDAARRRREIADDEYEIDGT
ncbi:hypothetical protein TH66_11880 [Carbonactinospora thermoautotrophica]|uniref:YdbS-like PH domain-containing protein n=1 Tax=Carbonactinospora thermoautotrophica TaxID=1469144 RepID=A0A132NI96_9ACTN|nr:PH domain-containing protein [Carbonactinospora thermoautotrophica]KWX03553.1 hypothetical protein TH66_11880 [Carbonactinospora thermoautotrophica]KWX09798.1 hypothetical protein TR74_07470 [Carbonactinospora thermoautotrophica]